MNIGRAVQRLSPPQLQPGRFRCESCGAEWNREHPGFPCWVWCPACRGLNVARVGDLKPEAESAPPPGPQMEPVQPEVAPLAELGQRERAARFVQEALANGPMPASDLDRLARESGIAQRTLDRARKDAGVRAIREGGFGKDGHWVLSLPKSATGTGAGEER